MRYLLVLMVALLSGCASTEVAPFARVGLGYSVESGDYGRWNSAIDETGCRGNFDIGLQFRYTNPAWYKPSEGGLSHTSQCTRKPEVALDQWYVDWLIGGFDK